jgi:hypothetical protein
VLFLKDTDNSLVSVKRGNWTAALEIFKTTCLQHSTKKLLCSHFIEAVRKYRLLTYFTVGDVAMHDREIDLAARMCIFCEQKGEKPP